MALSTNAAITHDSEHDAIDPLKQRQGVFKNFTEDIWAVVISSIVIIAVLVVVGVGGVVKFSVPAYQWTTIEDLTGKVLSGGNMLPVALIGAACLLLSTIAIALSGGSVKKFVPGFLVIFFLAILSLVLAGNKTVSYYGIEYVVFALLAGLILGNVSGVPIWLREAARSEFFIKTGLVILGTSILFTDIVKAGLPGILQGIFVVIAVWFFAMWLCRKLKVDDEFAVILASAVSICGVSAAIVASGAIKGDKKKLSYVTTLVLIVAIPMMIIQPWLIKHFNINEIVGGAWLGGTLDTTASVTAAAQLVGPEALKAGVIVKFSQNVLIGVAAFFIALWWTYRKAPNDSTTAAVGTKPGLGVVWERFPKFVLGFIAASLVFSFLIPVETTKQVSGILNSVRTIWFALAFVAIGIEARLGDLVKIQGGRPAIAFIGAQLFNLVWTLIWAYLLFGGYLLVAPNLK